MVLQVATALDLPPGGRRAEQKSLGRAVGREACAARGETRSPRTGPDQKRKKGLDKPLERVLPTDCMPPLRRPIS